MCRRARERQSTFDGLPIEVIEGDVLENSLPDGSVPRTPLMRVPYMAYLNYAIPLLGRAFLGNPDNYRLLGIYTSRFEDCSTMADHLREAGWCASSVRGVKLG